MGPRRKQSGKASWRRKHFGGGRESQSIASKHEEVALKKRRGDRKLSRRRGGASYAHFPLFPSFQGRRFAREGWGVGSLGLSTGSHSFGGIALITFDGRHCPHTAGHQALAFSRQSLGLRLPCPHFCS